MNVKGGGGNMVYQIVQIWNKEYIYILYLGGGRGGGGHVTDH